MPTLPWQAVERPHDQTAVAVVMASRFRVRRFRDVPRFFFDSLRIHRQVLAAEGAFGVSLVAHPLRREFFTLSAWADRVSVNKLVSTDSHRSAMRRHHPVMAQSRFVFWEVTCGELPVTWDDSYHRLEGRATVTN
jgi:hypothetical protein